MSELGRYQKAPVLRRAFATKRGRGDGTATGANQEALVDGAAGVLRLAHGFEEVTHGFEAVLGVDFEVVGDGNYRGCVTMGDC